MKFATQNSKFAGGGIDIIDTQKEIVERFATLCFDKPGWYRGTVDYKLGDNGEATQIDELKITFCVDKSPIRFFKELSDKPETRWIPGEEKGTQKMQHKVDGIWKDVGPFWID